jgi:hypothetical protein
MELKIKKFKELVEKEISLPQAIISGANGAGKTTILDAFYFVVDGKKADGTVFGGEIYSQFAKSKSDLIAEVQLKINGVNFCRRCEGSEKRKAGTAIVELVRNINTTLIVEKEGKRSIVSQKEWNDEISVYFPENWRYFTNPLFLQAQKQADVKDFVFKLFDLVEFNSKNKDVAKSKIAEKKAEIAKLDLLISEYSKTPKPVEVEDLTESYNKKIEAARKKINIPTLSEADVLHNAKIEKQIAEIQVQQPKYKDFEEEIRLPAILLEKSYLPLNDVSELEAEIENLKNSEYDNVSVSATLEVAEKRNAKKAEIEDKIKNYDSIKAGLKCIKCPVCTDLFCEVRSVEIESLEDLQKANEDLEYINIEELKLKFEAEKVEFEAEKSNKIAELEAELKKLQAENEKIKAKNAEIKAENNKALNLYNEKVAKINEKNEQIRANNERIKSQNAEIKATFEAEKSKKLAELRASIKYPGKVDNSEIEAEISKLEAEKEENRQLFLQFTKLQAIYKNAQKEIDRLQQEKAMLQASLVDYEQQYIVESRKEIEHYRTIERDINKEIEQFGIKFKFYKKLISSDEFKPEFNIVLNNKEYNSNGEAFIQKIELCNFFQKRKGITLPIWCDEIAILDDFNREKLIYIFENYKNIVLLEKNSDDLKIINF